MEIFRTIVGPAAEGDVYFPRDYLDDRLWMIIRSGEQFLPDTAFIHSSVKVLFEIKKEAEAY
ncbi:MAG TPA: hypothetical protein ENI20_20440 [Bacteroides sp.]|nr:hypothetical protein [Bacteroides sp.]